MKKYLILLVLILTIGLIPVVRAENKEKVKVYVFAASGCNWCEKQISYLKGLDGYNKTFEIVEKELYIDTSWQEGKDYNLGVKVVNLFEDACFQDVTYEGTPLVVISDVYAKTTYNTSLESFINEAYEKGDKDIVGCLSKGNNDCKIANSKCENNNYTSTEKKSINSNDKILIVIILIVMICGGAGLILLSHKKD